MYQDILEIIDELGTITHPEAILLKLCCDIVLYSEDLSTPEQKEIVLELFDDYTTIYESKLRWTVNPKTGSWKRLKKGLSSYLQPKEWLLGVPQHEGFDFIYHGGNTSADASDVTFYATGAPDYGVKEHDLGMVACRFPLADVIAGNICLPDIMQRWCTLLKPWHGRSGLIFGRSFKYEDGSLARSKETEMLLRWPGLNLCDYTETIYVLNFQRGLYNGPRCADWLIALSGHFVDKLGGLQEVTQQMAPLPVHPYEGGAILQAGPAPALGSSVLGLTLPDYEKLASVIEPVRSKNMHSELCMECEGEEPRLTGNLDCPEELSKRWHERFSPKTGQQ